MSSFQGEQVNWNEANLTTLRTMWAEGHSCAVISLKIPNSTRSGVIGKIHRLKLPVPDRKNSAMARSHIRVRNAASAGNALAPSPAPRSRPDPLPRRNPSNSIAAKIAIAEAEPGLPENLKGEAPDGTGIQLIELTDATCHWPRGNPGDANFEFCGGKALPSLPYCARHSRIAYTAAADRRRPQPRV